MNNNDKWFSEWESDFYHYLSSPLGGINSHSRTNYMSWLKFLSKTYPITSSLDETAINQIIESERTLLESRDRYNTPRDLTNFRSALRKFRQFIQDDYTQIQEKEIEDEIKKVQYNNSLNRTERDAIMKARVGQGLFRQRLLDHWGGCSITSSGMYDCLIASHIKPWKDSTNEERLSVYNGLLLLPNYDKLFDKGYISFDGDGKIIYSRFFPSSERELLGMDKNVHLIHVVPQHKVYLDYHNEHCLMQ
ncbi:MAG: HNH endonuclease [Prevotella sp.]|nr:HNH endonuclease [Prevotella sp.]